MITEVEHINLDSIGVSVSLQKQFKKFDKKIYLTKQCDAYKDARAKEHSILEDIRKQFIEEGYPVVKHYRQGSFKTDTAIVSLEGDFDVDRAIIIHKDKAPDNPVECKEVIYDILEKRGFKNHKIKTPCVTADYASLNLHIDYAVFQVDDFESYDMALGKTNSKDENKKWEYSESKQLIDWINGNDNAIGFSNLTNEEKFQFKRLVRYMKRWRDYNFLEANRSYIYSIGLTIMIKESFHPSIDENGKENDLESLINTIKYILKHKGYFIHMGSDQYDVKVNIPFEPRVDVFRKHGKTQGTVFRNKLASLLEKLKKTNTESDLKKQCEVLQGVFGDDFEIVDESKSYEKVVNPSPGIVIPSQGA